MSERLETIRQRADAATPGPWTIDGCEDDSEWGTGWSVVGPEYCEEGAWTEKNAAFAAAARSDIPWLLAEVERLTKALEFVEFSADDNETRLTEYIVKLERVVEAARELDRIEQRYEQGAGDHAIEYRRYCVTWEQFRAALAALEAKP